MERIDHFRQRWLERENRIWDERGGFDTRGWVIPDRHSTVSGVADGFPYAGTHVRLGRAMLRALRSSAEGATFVDLGSGKGRVLLLASEHPFVEVVGVEYDEQLHRAAEGNVARLADRGEPNVRLEFGDVREFKFPETPLVIYLNNPFPESVLDVVLANLCVSRVERPRPITIAYHQLREEDVEHDTRNVELLAKLDFLTRRRVTIRGPVDAWLLRQYIVHGFSGVASGP
ncbi:MAG: class I SAM-dependent methyltransferase [Gaiellaceae bacterium]